MKSKPQRLRLRDWARLDDLRQEIEVCAGEDNLRGLVDGVHKVIELTTGENKERDFWLEDMELYIESLEVNTPKKPFPILTTKEKGKNMPWEYPGRSWYFWLNTFAKHYGWSEEQIAMLDIDDCIGLYQEISVDTYSEREWQNSLSEMAYSYDKATKKSKLISLPKPDWMRPQAKPSQKPKTFMMPVAAAPLGVVVNLDDTGTKKVELSENSESQKTQSV